MPAPHHGSLSSGGSPPPAFGTSPLGPPPAFGGAVGSSAALRTLSGGLHLGLANSKA